MIVLRTKGEVSGVAFSQIFFLVGLAFGILTAFGSHCPRYEPAVINATMISRANSMLSFISGVAVFVALVVQSMPGSWFSISF